MTRRLALAVCFIAIILTAHTGAQTIAPTHKVVVGILPAYDVSGEKQAEVFVINLTSMIFSELQSSAVGPVLLNPGGLYTPLSVDEIREYGRELGADLLLVATMLRPEKPKNSSQWTLKVELQLIDARTGQNSQAGVSTVEVNKSVMLGEVHQVRNFWGGTAGFDKQPLGRAAREMAQSVRIQVLSQAPTMLAQGSANPPAFGTGSCVVRFQVRYRDQKQSSKAYSLIVNGREESFGLQEGIGKLSLNSGPALVKVQVSDAPYKMPTQCIYQANTYVDCSQPDRELALELGSLGEATLKWR